MTKEKLLPLLEDVMPTGCVQVSILHHRYCVLQLYPNFKHTTNCLCLH